METSVATSFTSFFSLFEILVLVALGCITFATTVLDDWLNPKKEFRKFAWYIQEFIYTLLSITIGLAASAAFEFSKPVSYLIAILMGLIGSTLIRKVKLRQEAIADGVIDSVEERIHTTIETSTTEKTTVESYSPQPGFIESTITPDEPIIIPDMTELSPGFKEAHLGKVVVKKPKAPRKIVVKKLKETVIGSEVSD